VVEGTADYRLYVCYGANCPQRGATAIHAELERLIAVHGLAERVLLRTGNCNRLCRLGPSLIVYPGAIRYGELTAAALAEIVAEHLIGGRPAARWQRQGDHSL
jgi:NADH-quinone oxidoreductase subunit F/NADP-reducing hydrogenase subunit HndC